ncbi:MAG: hypothetical protein AB7F50_05660 [Fimbriimonadaceae bacterium]
MRKRTLFASGLGLLALAAVVTAQDQGVQAVIGNVFLQNTTPGTPQIGHATLTGTFRAGQVFVQQASPVTIPVVGNNLSTSGSTVGGSFSVASPGGKAVRGTATSQTAGTGVHGESRATEGFGVVGLHRTTQNTIGGAGVFGSSDSPTGSGVVGTGAQGVGVLGSSIQGVGIKGSSFFHTGIQGDSEQGNGVQGFAKTASGVRGTATTGAGVSGLSSSGIGVSGQSSTFHGMFGSTITASGAGVFGRNTNPAGQSAGVWGETSSTSSGVGVLGASPASGTSIGVYGVGLSATGFGVFSEGRTGATGTKSFVIDHPLDPENHYLMHFSHEGPEALNVYSGTTVTDRQGWQTVRLPDYFESINRDPRVHLTIDDTSDDFVMSKVVGGVRNGVFRLRTSKGNVRVYWRVEAVRNDRWVQKHGIEAEPMKAEANQGTYLHPELYGKPATLGQRAAAASSRSERGAGRP